MIAAPASGQGKTLITLGLLRALRRGGVDIRSAKSGPDYIDPAFHAAATGRPCLTLDSWAADPAQLAARADAGAGAMLIVEGAMGLLDAAAGAPPGGPGSALALAEALDLPVLLVIDIARMGQSAGALAAGFAGAARGRLCGVILNQAGSARHAAMVRAAVAPVLPVLGAVHRDPALAVPSRHLGLVQADERPDLEAFLEQAADRVAGQIDLAAVQDAARPVARPRCALRRLAPLGQRIAVASDRAFGFAYGHMLADWRAAGADILTFSPLADQPPAPTADAVFLPGGYPELYAGRLAGAAVFHQGMRAAAARGALIYGECGGYMVLGDGLVDADGRRHAMLGLVRLETSFAARRRHLGYRRLQALGGPWQGPLAGHEFHYATTLLAEGAPLFRMHDAAGTDLGPAGLCQDRVMGSFAHVIEPG